MVIASRTGTLTVQVEEMLRNQIISGEIPLGSRISEKQLAESIGVSKTPVREALLRLQDEDLVTIQPQKGTFVFTPDEHQLRDVILLRSILEPAALKCAMENDPEQLIKQLKRVYRNMQGCMEESDFREYSRQDMYFHDLFFEHANNPYLAKSYRLIRSLLAVLRLQLQLDKTHLFKSFKEHKDIITHLEANQLNTVLEILESHIGLQKSSYWSDISKIIERMSAGNPH